MNTKYFRLYRFVYLTTNLITGKIYVGQHTTYDINDGYIGSGTDFYKDVKKHGKANFDRVIIDRNICNQEQLDEHEIYWIAKLGARDKSIGYNIHEGGGGFKIGHNVPEYIRQILREVNTGKKRNLTAEQIENLRTRMLGDKNPAKQPGIGLKISKAKKGVPRSEEYKQSVSGKNNHRYGIKDSPETIQKKKEAKIGWIPWNKDLTKETSPAMMQSSINHLGKPQSEESNQKRSKTLKNLPFTTCEFCGLQSRNKGAMTRFHGDNCKHNPNRNITLPEQQQKQQVS